MKIKLIALLGTLTFAKNLGVASLNVFLDLKILIEWSNKLVALHASSLEHWKDKVHAIINSFSFISLARIYRVINHGEDDMSKKGLEIQSRLIYIEK